MKTTCPFCDSNKVEKVEVTDTFPVPFCEDATISHPIFRCNNCGEEGDFDNTLDKALTKAIDKAQSDSAPKLMDELAQSGVTMTYFEKALRLPFRTTARWKRGRISHSSLALLRIIRFSPSLLALADDNYSDEAAAKYQIFHPWDFFERNTSNPRYVIACAQDQSGTNHLGVAFTGTVHSNAIQSISNELKWETIR